MKAIELYSDRNNQVAKGINGQWYARSFGWNGYANGWQKWYAISEPKAVTELENRYSGEMMQIEPGRIVLHGFDRLYREDNGHKSVRLPNA